MKHNYDSIINLKYQKSSKHTPMSKEQRAAQFMPFSALTGYDNKIKEARRATDKKRILSSDELASLNEEIIYLRNNLGIEAEIIYFIPDKYKTGGRYENKRGFIKSVDETNKLIIFMDKTSITFSAILSIKINK